jgi:hypothetical protein
MEWSNPVLTVTRPPWTTYLVPQWAWLLRLMEPVRQDGIGKVGWERAVAVLDHLPHPGTPEQANARWRSCVVVCWQTWESWQKRVAAQPRRRSA